VKYFLVGLSLLGLTQFAFAQRISTLMGARAHGLAYASVTLEDEWSILNNTAGLARHNTTSVAATHLIHPSLTAFNKSALSVSLPLKSGSMGVGAFKFGDDLYNEQLLTLGYAQRVGNTALGLRTNYSQFNAEGFGRKGQIAFSMGSITTLSSHVLVGINIHNILQPKFDKNWQEQLPTIITAGVGIKASENFNVYTELEKDISKRVGAKAAIEYHYLQKFFVRTGYNMMLNNVHVGVGFHKQSYHIDYGFSHHPFIGVSHQASIHLPFKRKKS
jgi:hypothetical protein